MDSTPKTQVIETLVELLRETLIRGNTVEVPGLGLFRVEHQLSQIDEQADGDVRMIPPRDVIAFVPDR